MEEAGLMGFSGGPEQGKLVSALLELAIRHINKIGTGQFKTLSPDSKTQFERKPRMPEIQGIKGEAAGSGCEPLTKHEIWGYSFFRKAEQSDGRLK